jgi:hypothetical protein
MRSKVYGPGIRFAPSSFGSISTAPTVHIREAAGTVAPRRDPAYIFDVKQLQCEIIRTPVKAVPGKMTGRQLALEHRP